MKVLQKISLDIILILFLFIIYIVFFRISWSNTKESYRLHIERINNGQKISLVTGGAGFIGSHLVDALLLKGHYVIVIDNFDTGRRKNLEHQSKNPNLLILAHDVADKIDFQNIDEVYHLASPASPPYFIENPIKTIKANTLGTFNMLEICRKNKAKFLLASTSEVYGNPLIHPQVESYKGNVNILGPRACYDESKRLAETLTLAYARKEGIDVRIARIFNTYGPRMSITDGRIISNFVVQALTNKSITIYGDGKQTRSLQYISDLISGLLKLMENNYQHPINLGNPIEYKVEEIAQIVKNVTHSSSTISYSPSFQDDPRKRKPSIEKALSILQWKPKIPLLVGLEKTIDYLKLELNQK